MNILYISPYDKNIIAQNGGYGVIAESFKRVLDLQKKLNIEYLNVNNISKSNIILDGTIYDVCILLTHPNSFENKSFKNNIQLIFKNCKRTYLHIFWETSIFPKNWEWLWTSDMFTGFISPSLFIYDIISKKTNKENHLIYSPIFKEDYKKYKIEPKEKVDEEKFTVLYIGQYTKRKGIEDAIVAFTQALSKYNDCRLIIKYHDLSDKEMPLQNFINYLVKTNTIKMNAELFIINENLEKDNIYSLYKESSVLLFPSRGEGYGLPCLEANMIGIPVIYTNWSATVETADFSGNMKVDYILDTAYGMSHYGYETEALYAVPLMKDLIANLNFLYTSWKENKIKYYETIKYNDDEIIKKFGKDVFLKQLNNLLRINE